MPGSPSCISSSDRHPAGFWLPALLAVAMMLGYIASFAIFVTQSEDFILVERQARATKQNLPITLDLTSPAPKPEALFKGWSTPEPWGTWTNGDESVAHFLIPELKPGLNLRLRIHLDRCFAPSSDHPVSIKVLIDEIKVMEETFVSSDTVVLEAEYLRKESGDRLNLVIRITGASSPSSRNLGNDRRVLGIGVSKIEILSVP
jgi:hypothetical protein